MLKITKEIKESSQLKKVIIGRTLQEKREKLNYSRSDLARHTGVISQFVANWERGQCLPPFKVISKLQEIFSMTKVDFVNLYTLASREAYSNYFGVG